VVKGELPGGYEAVFRYSLVDPAADVAIEAARFRPAFAHLALLEQIPGVDVRARVEAEKGSPLHTAEIVILDERRRAARAWLAAYAPERSRLVVRRDGLPAEAATLDAEARSFLAALADAVSGGDRPPSDGDDWQTAIYDVTARSGLPAGRAFAALYTAFLGRPNGPRAGWLLASLEPSFVVARLREAAAAAVPATEGR